MPTRREKVVQGATPRNRGLPRASGARAGPRLRLRPTRANTQPAFGCYLTNSVGVAKPAGLIVLTLAGDRISRITRLLDPGVRHRFGLSDPVA